MSQGEPAPLPAGTLVHGRYQVVAPVGQGGLGTVYQVTDVEARGIHVYALKEQWDLSSSARKQFFREGAWLKGLNHPHIPQVVEYFEWNDRLYLVMEFVEGENLEQKLQRAGEQPLAEQQVIAWLLPVCDALHYLHSRRPPLIHRDVKPANIIVTPSGRPVLVDLGIAKEHNPGANATATFVRKAGTEGYAAPEQYAAAGPTGPWSDVYGLGATLYQLLTSRVPPTAVERVTLDTRLGRPSEVNPTVSATTDAIVLKALAIRPADRFSSVLEVQRALADASLNAMFPTASALTPTRTPSSGRVPAIGQVASTPPPGSMSAVSQIAGAPRAPARPATTISASVATPLAPPRGHPHAESAFMQAQPDGSGGADAGPRRSLLSRTAVWGTAAAAVVLIVAVAVVALLQLNVPLDRSTPTDTVNGYFAAIRAQDYGRAWQYTTASSRGQSSQVTYTQNLKTGDARGGRVLKEQITNIETDGSGHATCTVAVWRAAAPNSPQSYTLNLTQYGSLWLIDNVTGG